LAGDIGSLAKQKSGILTDSLHEFCEIYPEVIFVAGNHEYWGTNIPEGQKVLKKIEKKLPGLVVLRVGKSLQHKNNRISGDTLWFPECGDAYLKRGWCDFTQIGGSRGGAGPGRVSVGEYSSEEDIQKEYNKFLSQERLSDIVVTHHLPTAESVAPEWRGSPYNHFFDGNLEPEFDRWEHLPRLWIHGHSHNSMDYTSRFGFRVYSNPLGYRHENRNPDFWSRLAIDTED
jgi:hypothetical protein